MKRGIAAFAAVLLVVFTCASASAGNHGNEDRDVKKGILLVAFGTSVPEARKAFDHIDRKVKTAFPATDVKWAYTSSIIRHKLAEQGKMIPSPEEALARMMDQGYTHVAVQSLHTIAGQEFHELSKNVKAFENMAGSIREIDMGYPLLSTQADIEAVSRAVIANIPKERSKDEAVVLMGHGTHHPANAFYAALMFNLQLKDPNIFVGTVEGWPEVGEIQEMLEGKGIEKAYLMPFMSVAGDHAKNDMAGGGDDSWKSVLTAEGITCVPILKGTGEYDNMVSIWVDHLKTSMAHLEEK
ncbi:MAG: sirohydrochlorin cobaltochelatase [Desulfarculaceae bacterium]|nr:sirohydrochlorin cobaltochelatase [Desulfarculaceae bacterium]